MALFRVRDGFISAQVEPEPRRGLCGVTCAEIIHLARETMPYMHFLV